MGLHTGGGLLFNVQRNNVFDSNDLSGWDEQRSIAVTAGPAGATFSPGVPISFSVGPGLIKGLRGAGIAGTRCFTFAPKCIDSDC